MNPQTISEKMMFSALRLIASNGSTGTGFFLSLDFVGKSVPVIITNKHVVNYNPNESVTFFLHTKSAEAVDEESLKITFNTKWNFHKDKDLCYCFANPLLEQIRDKMKKEVFYIPITENLIPDLTKLEELSAIEDVIMVGYPNGLWDQKNNLPLLEEELLHLILQ